MVQGSINRKGQIMNHERQQPVIHPDILQRLCHIAACYEMESAKMLNFILSVALDELRGREDDFTICVPTDFEDGTT